MHEQAVAACSINRYWPPFCFDKTVLGQSKSTAWALLQRLRAQSARAWAFAALIVSLIARCALANEALVRTQSSQFNEYHEKAEYLLNFTRYVEWPAKSFKQTNSPIVISILGQDRFGDDLRSFLADKMVQGRKLIVRGVTSLEECKDSQILFVSESEKKRTARVLQLLKASPVLTVGETDKFLQFGGIINFSLKDELLCLDINQTAAERVGLKISSKLLLIADRTKQAQRQPK